MEDVGHEVRVVYCIDTSSLIELQRRYTLPFFEPFWQLLDRLAAEGRLIAPYEVHGEIEDGSRDDDRLKQWADTHPEVFGPKGEQWETARGIVRGHPDLVGHNEPTKKADPYVLALARERQDRAGLLYSDRVVVIAEETRKGGIREVAGLMELQVLSLLELMREEGLAISGPS